MHFSIYNSSEIFLHFNFTDDFIRNKNIFLIQQKSENQGR